MILFASWRNSRRGRKRPNEDSDTFPLDGLYLSTEASGIEEGPGPPLLPFERLLVTVLPNPTMLVFEPLGLVLIFSNRILVTRPVEVDHVARA